MADWGLQHATRPALMHLTRGALCGTHSAAACLAGGHDAGWTTPRMQASGCSQVVLPGTELSCAPDELRGLCLLHLSTSAMQRACVLQQGPLSACNLRRYILQRGVLSRPAHRRHARVDLHTVGTQQGASDGVRAINREGRAARAEKGLKGCKDTARARTPHLRKLGGLLLASRFSPACRCPGLLTGFSEMIELIARLFSPVLRCRQSGLEQRACTVT